jgi:hypothetical protein
MNPLLTSLANVKEYAELGLNDYTLLNKLIARTSALILNYINRPSLYQATRTDYYDGYGGNRQILKVWPVLSVSSLSVNGISIPPSLTPMGHGFFLEPADTEPPGNQQSLILRGHKLYPGTANIQVTYTTGYVVQNEVQTVPSIGEHCVTPFAPYGSWMDDSGVAYADGTALTKVTGTPAAGQYSIANGIYSFSPSDAGVAVSLSYSYVPRDIEQACIEWVLERYSYKTRMSQTTKSLGGQETMGFRIDGIPPFVKEVLQPYVRTTLL